MSILDNEGHDPMGLGNLPNNRRTQPERDRDLAEGRILVLRAIVRDLTTVLEKRNAEIERLRTALGKIASKNDLSGVEIDSMEAHASAAFGALHACELLARDALDDEQKVDGNG